MRFLSGKRDGIVFCVECGFAQSGVVSDNVDGARFGIGGCSRFDEDICEKAESLANAIDFAQQVVAVNSYLVFMYEVRGRRVF